MTECMTQEDAMNMNNEQAIQILKPLRDMMRDQHGCPISDAFFALNKAIEALSAQERKTGRWIWETVPTIDGLRTYTQVRCSECGERFITDVDYCPNCGSYNGGRDTE